MLLSSPYFILNPVEVIIFKPLKANECDNSGGRKFNIFVKKVSKFKMVYPYECKCKIFLV